MYSTKNKLIYDKFNVNTSIQYLNKLQLFSQIIFSEMLTADVDLDDGTSVKEKAKALDSKLILQPSPCNRKSRLSPDSPGKRLSQRSPDRADDRKSKSLDINLDSEMSKSIADSITDTPDDITDNLSMYR